MRKILITFLLFLYNKVKRSNLLRKIIKYLYGTRKFVYKFNNFNIYTSTSSAIESNIIFNTYNENSILKLIQYYATKGYNFIDIGANIGLHSLMAAKSSTEIEIYSFEPEPNNFNWFIKNIGLNNFENIRPFKMGLGNFKGTLALNINQDWNKGRHSLKVDFGEKNKKITIPIIYLDDFNELITSEKLFIKIDVEGFEKEVIDGAQKIINKISQGAIIIELLEEINGIDVCKSIVDTLKSNEFDLIYKVNTNNQFVKVNNYEGSADYVLLKGHESKIVFDNFNK